MTTSNFLLGKKKYQKSKNHSLRKVGGRPSGVKSLLSNLVDIIISSEYYKKKLIFTNTKNQKKKWRDLCTNSGYTQRESCKEGSGGTFY